MWVREQLVRLRGSARALTVRSWPTRVWTIGPVVLVLAYAAILRFDAITLKYGPVTRPSWLHALGTTRLPGSVIRPPGVTWAPELESPHRDGPPSLYTSDPYTYLQRAREMTSFYAASRREPLFPAVTKVFLVLLSDQDVAVSFASATCSLLAVFGTFLLGRAAFSHGVGLGAAALMATEYDVISWGASGWRDDAFTASVVFFAYAIVRYAKTPSPRLALWLGLVGGAACLVRITALSFLLPGFAYLLVAADGPWRRRWRDMGVAAALATVLVAPFLFNCWRAFGDPFYAINVHADVYRETEGQPVDASQSAAQYAASQARRAPFRTLDTAVLGLTSYPFANKWQGFDVWIPFLGYWMSRLSLIGLFVCALSPAGRSCLVVVFTSLLPYALTWRLISDWRFTEHAYPFLLVAACLTLASMARIVRPSWIRERIRQPPSRRHLATTAAAAALVLAGTWATVRQLPMLVVGETLGLDEPTAIMTGARDGAFYVRGWNAPVVEGNVTARTSRSSTGVVRLPLPTVRDYDLVLRLDPFPAPASDVPPDSHLVRLHLNGEPLAVLSLTWDPQRVGAYQARIPAALVRRGVNDLRLTAETRSASTARIRIWYVGVRPVPGGTAQPG